MEEKVRRPIPKTMIVAGISLIVAMIIGIKVDRISGGLLLLLGLLIIGLDSWLMQCSIYFLKDTEKSAEQVSRYRGFASFYLKDRGLTYSKDTFYKAIAYNWYDVATMCLLLGISNNLQQEEKEKFVLQALQEEKKKLFATLVKANWNTHFLEEGHSILFMALEKTDSSFLEILLKAGVSPNNCDTKKNYPIFIAIKEDKKEIIKLLLRYGVDLKLQNTEGLTPLFSAVAEGNIEIAQMLLEKVATTEELQKPVKYEKLEDNLFLEQRGNSIKEQELLIKLIQTKDKVVLNHLKTYFSNKLDYTLSIDSGVELYARLSTLVGSYEKHTNTTKERELVYTEKDCVEDLLKVVHKHYKLAPAGAFRLENIYKNPKCIESKRIPCPTCKGHATISCAVCGGKGNIKCPTCKGAGETTCEKCKGSGEISCEQLKAYLECKNCKDEQYVCTQCDTKGMEVCPKCGGHGGKKCTCPKNKQIKCPHCDNGYIEVKKGEYRKCRQCGGTSKICLLCNNTGWINIEGKSKTDICERCDGTGKVRCSVCRGKKRIKCTKAHTEPCDCNKGKVSCSICGGSKVVKCETCKGSGKEPCKECRDGSHYANVYLDFKCENKVQKESILSERGTVLLQAFTPKVVEATLQDHGYVDKVYTWKGIKLEKEQITINHYKLNKALQLFLTDKEVTGVLEILELIPLYYTSLNLRKESGELVSLVCLGDKYLGIIKNQEDNN